MIRTNVMVSIFASIKIIVNLFCLDVNNKHEERFSMFMQHEQLKLNKFIQN